MSKKFDFESLTIGEIDFIEKTTGRSASTIGQDETPQGALLGALVTVFKRRSGEPQYTFVDASLLTIKEANAIIGGDEDESPEAGE
jgi:hypothetical protein